MDMGDRGAIHANIPDVRGHKVVDARTGATLGGVSMGVVEDVFRVAGRTFEALIHRTRKDIAVRSKGEVMVAEVLDSLSISRWKYELSLYQMTSPKDFCLPDFTVSYEGDVFYWEHLGMLSVLTHREAWEQKREWYKANGLTDRLIVSAHGPSGNIDAGEIERIAREHVHLR